jgi:hypothetical protein
MNQSSSLLKTRSLKKAALTTKMILGEDRLPAKPISDKNHITVMLPTRNRVSTLQVFLDSVSTTVTNKDKVDVWIYVDEDDSATQDFLQSAWVRSQPVKINYFLGPQTIAMAEMNHNLWQASTSNAGSYLCATDDYVNLTPGWDEIVRAAFNKYPDRLVLVYPDDPSTPELATVPILSAEWINLTGHFHTEYFPFWFDDMWIDEIAQMIDRKVQIPMQVAPQGGKGRTPRMHNLPFWQNFYVCTSDERLASARELRVALYREGSPEFIEGEERAKSMAQKFVMKNTYTEEHLKLAEPQYSDPSKMATPRAKTLYAIIEAQAVAHLWIKYQDRVIRRDYAGARNILNALDLAEQKTPALDFVRAGLEEQIKKEIKTTKERESLESKHV